MKENPFSPRVDVFIEKNPEASTVEMHPSRWPLKTRLFLGVALVTGMDICFKKPNIMTRIGRKR